jgi:hypothetical protein
VGSSREGSVGKKCVLVAVEGKALDTSTANNEVGLPVVDNPQSQNLRKVPE